jgi:Uncharacterised nucleotidyltransferase
MTRKALETGAKMKLRVKEPQTYFFYRRVIGVLNRSFVPFLMGGGFAFEFYTHIGRGTKDMDLLVRRSDLEQAFEVLTKAGFETERTFPHWLAKVYYEDSFIDIIFSSGNGLCEVDDLWFKHAKSGQVFGFPVKFCPPEEMIWTKAFVMERERYDGGDVAHLLRQCGDQLDWHRLVSRFGGHWRVLLSHLILFGYIYPSERQRIPQHVMRELLRLLEPELTTSATADQACQGPLLSRTQYRADVEKMGYKDARLAPDGKMSPKETIDWTAAADPEEQKQ